ncbi:hypothetical protein JTE90_029553 [Oedothorax gibbosus]|uniref:Uncharacterized protein n=1 Tax=Oedothorax gibbosus TaxID=931172 RepID=A0AAV6VB47_9ARAC|nr:hypothetical protein JTE90_029553 [Oedothorax gibbosus]
MPWFAYFGFVVFIGPSFAWPVGSWADTALGFDIQTDYMDGYYGPWSADYLRGSRYSGIPGPRSLWQYAPYDYIDPAMDYLYGAHPYPRGMDVSKEKYVKDYPYGETEVGVRDSVSVRPGGYRSRAPYFQRPSFRPMDRYGYNPYASDYDMQPFFSSRMFAAGLGTPRTSSLRTGGDFMYLRR